MPSLPMVSDESDEENKEVIQEKAISKKSVARSKKSKKRGKVQEDVVLDEEKQD